MSRSGAFTVGTVVMTFAAFPVYVAALALASQQLDPAFPFTALQFNTALLS